MGESGRIPEEEIGAAFRVGDPITEAPTAAPGAKEGVSGRFCAKCGGVLIRVPNSLCLLQCGVCRTMFEDLAPAPEPERVAPGAETPCICGTVFMIYGRCLAERHQTFKPSAELEKGFLSAPAYAEYRQRASAGVPRLSWDPSGLLEMVGLAAEGRCMACGWPIRRPEEAGVATRSCEQGNCSFRPVEHSSEYPTWWKRTQLLQIARKYLAGGFQSNHDDVQDAAAGEK